MSYLETLKDLIFGRSEYLFTSCGRAVYMFKDGTMLQNPVCYTDHKKMVIVRDGKSPRCIIQDRESTQFFDGKEASYVPGTKRLLGFLKCDNASLLISMDRESGSLYTAESSNVANEKFQVFLDNHIIYKYAMSSRSDNSIYLFTEAGGQDFSALRLVYKDGFVWQERLSNIQASYHCRRLFWSMETFEEQHETAIINENGDESIYLSFALKL